MTTSGHGDAEDGLFAGAGESRALCRSVDWRATPLGAVQSWPQNLRAAVRICLECQTAMAIYAGPEFTLIHNDSYRRILGGTYPRTQGRPVREVCSEIWDAIGPELRRCLDQGVPARQREARLPLERDGHEQDASFAYSLTPIREEDGRVVGVLNVLEEIPLDAREARHAFLLRLADTLRPLADPELVQAEATRMLGEHLGASRVDYAEVDADANTLYVRACYSAPGIASTLGERQLDSSGAYLADAMRSGRTLVLADTTRVLDLTQQGRRSRREMGILSQVAVPLMSAGRLTAVLAVHQAIARDWSAEEVALIEETAVRAWEAAERARIEAALRQSQAQLREGDRRKQQFLAVLSHELRNPLAPVKNSLYILDRAAPGGEQARRAKQVIERQVDQLSHLVDELSDLTRMTNGTMKHQRGRLELNQLAGHVVEENRALFEQARIALEMVPAPDQVFIRADGAHVAQVAGNLLQTAAKLTPSSGRVTVTVSSDASARQAALSVAGMGSGNPDGGENDLGLELLEGLVAQHGGTIETKSARPGHGSKVIIRLPLDFTDTASTQEEARPARAECRRVLVIEDNIDAANSLRELLELLGHVVAVAFDGPEGISRARELHPDIVLCDIGLPGMDGHAVARAFRSDAELRNVHLVALTGYALPEDLERAAQAGFEQHVAKPPSLDKLIGILGGGLLR